MASDQTYVDYVCEQAHLGLSLSYRRMFGEYALYLETKVIAFICDNQLYLKPTLQARELLSEVIEAPPYPGAKPYFCIDAYIDDHELLRRLFIVTADALPLPKPKSKSKATKSTVATSKIKAPKAKIPKVKTSKAKSPSATKPTPA